ncbi:MAG: OmpA family protein [Rhodospirillaceae bacterium]
MNIRHTLMASVFTLVLPITAQAGTRGLYVGAGLGADFAVDAKASGAPGSGTVIYDTGPSGLASVGYGFGPIRAELEGSYRDNDVSRSPGGSKGYTRTWGLLANALYDFDTGTRFTPYLGVGIGAGFVHDRVTGLYNGDDTTFAYQGIAGVSFAVTDRMSVTADYRYFATTDAEFNSGGSRWKVENANHVITAGLRWTFGVATPVAAAGVPGSEAAPSAAPSNEFLVLFDWDKSNLTSEARKIVADAASTAGNVHPVTILVTGHTDSSGSDAYNQRLSERRAASVKAELIRRGIAGDMIQTIGKGEAELLVPTADGVREHSNRRAQIVLRIS